MTENGSGQRRVTVFVSGSVQGVGFRWWARSQARRLGLAGFARNLPDGRVEVLAQGAPDAVTELETLLTEQPSTTGRPGRVTSVTSLPGDPRPDVRSFGQY